jgi:membrane-bound ClpP family serine protease
MAGADMTDEALVAFLRGHPDFRNRVASIALAMENVDGDLDEADAAEERLVEELRHLGREALQGWAEKRVEVTEKEIRQQPSMHRQGKKNSAGARNSAK